MESSAAVLNHKAQLLTQQNCRMRHLSSLGLENAGRRIRAGREKGQGGQESRLKLTRVQL